MKRQVGLFDFVLIVDKEHKNFGGKGQITDYDTFDKEYIVHFDKLTDNGNVYWVCESARVKLEQVARISKFELERMT